MIKHRQFENTIIKTNDISLDISFSETHRRKICDAHDDWLAKYETVINEPGILTMTIKNLDLDTDAVVSFVDDYVIIDVKQSQPAKALQDEGMMLHCHYHTEQIDTKKYKGFMVGKLFPSFGEGKSCCGTLGNLTGAPIPTSSIRNDPNYEFGYDPVLKRVGYILKNKAKNL